MNLHMRFKCLFLLFSVSLSSCNGLSSAKIEQFKKIKEIYYKQRFESVHNNVYYFQYAAHYATEVEELYLPNENCDLDIVNSIDDITLYKCFDEQNGAYIVSFLFNGRGISPSKDWKYGCQMTFIENEPNSTTEDKRYSLEFEGTYYPPEVYKDGVFYYIHEAFQKGIVSFKGKKFSKNLDPFWTSYYVVKGYDVNV